MVRHCFTLDQQQRITRSKYITDKGYAVLDESNSDDIIFDGSSRCIDFTLENLYSCICHTPIDDTDKEKDNETKKR